MSNGDIGEILGGALVAGVLATGPGGAAGAGGGGTRPGGHERRGRMTMLQALTAGSTFNAEWLATNIPGAENTHDAMNIMSRLPTAQFNAITSAMGTAAGEAGDLAALGAGVMVGANDLGIPYDPVRIVSDRPYIVQVGALVKIAAEKRGEEGPAADRFSNRLSDLVNGWNDIDFSEPGQAEIAMEGLGMLAQQAGELGDRTGVKRTAQTALKISAGTLEAKIMNSREAYHLNAYRAGRNSLIGANSSHLDSVRQEMKADTQALERIRTSGAADNKELVEKVLGTKGAAHAADYYDSGLDGISWLQKGEPGDGRTGFLQGISGKEDRLLNEHTKGIKLRETEVAAGRVSQLLVPVLGKKLAYDPDRHLIYDENGNPKLGPNFAADIQAGLTKGGKGLTVPELRKYGTALDSAVGENMLDQGVRDSLYTNAQNMAFRRALEVESLLDETTAKRIRSILENPEGDPLLAAIDALYEEGRLASITAQPSILLRESSTFADKYKNTLFLNWDRPAELLDRMSIDSQLRELVVGEQGLLGKITEEDQQTLHSWSYGGRPPPDEIERLGDMIGPLVSRLGFTGVRPDQLRQAAPLVNALVTMTRDYKASLQPNQWKSYVDEGGTGIPEVLNLGEDLTWEPDPTLLAEMDKAINAEEARLAGLSAESKGLTDTTALVGLKQADDALKKAQDMRDGYRAHMANSSDINGLLSDVGFALTSGSTLLSVSEAVGGRIDGENPLTGMGAKSPKGAAAMEARIGKAVETLGYGSFTELHEITFGIVKANAHKFVKDLAGDPEVMKELLHDQVVYLRSRGTTWAQRAVRLEEHLPETWPQVLGGMAGVILPDRLEITEGKFVNIADASKEDIGNWIFWAKLAHYKPTSARGLKLPPREKPGKVKRALQTLLED